MDVTLRAILFNEGRPSIVRPTCCGTMMATLILGAREATEPEVGRD
jgi:hypothetical protein